VCLYSDSACDCIVFKEIVRATKWPALFCCWCVFRAKGWPFSGIRDDEFGKVESRSIPLNLALELLSTPSKALKQTFDDVTGVGPRMGLWPTWWQKKNAQVA
jgi:hypothetical protein